MIFRFKDVPDVTEAISREIEYQVKRGAKPVRIRISPEVHEAMRLAARMPTGAVLLEHDGLPVVVDKKMIGIGAWKIEYSHTPPLPERMRG
ncbi:MAG: hypothetical protein QN144_10150 [Armatimonadota bacterium]|nr:hypothetical protein [Armatimonadota bacterium]